MPALFDEVTSGTSSEQAAAALFLTLVVASLPAILWLNRDQWFFLDEFAFLFKRDISEPSTLLRPHWGHLTVLPAALYQAIYRVVGLHLYWPYQIPVVVAHLVLATQVRAFARRCDVGPWVATAAACGLLFFGPGRENIAWGFQVTLTGALALAFAALLVADREEPSAKRLAFASTTAAMAVACSNVGLIAVISVGLTLGLRRGRTVAIAVVTPALLLFAVWRVIAPESEFDVPPATVGEAIPFGARVLWESVDSFTPWWPVAVLLLVLMAVGAWLLARRGDSAKMPQRAFVGLSAGAALTAAAIGLSRAADPFITADTGRYTYVVVALAIVPLAIATDQLVRYFAGVSAVVIPVVVALGVPFNAVMFSPSAGEPPLRTGDPGIIAWMAELVAESDIAPDVVIEGELVAGDLIRARVEGRIPDPPADDREARADALLVIALGLSWEEQDECEALDLTGPVTVDVGQVLRSDSSIWAQVAEDGKRRGLFGRVYSGPPPFETEIRFGPVDLWLEPVDDGTTIEVCNRPG